LPGRPGPRTIATCSRGSAGASPASRIPDADWQATLAEVRIVGPRPAEDLERLNALTAEFLARKRFSATHDLELDERKCRLIAVQACLPVLHLGFDWLKGWREVIVYPGQFRVRRHDHDEDTHVVSEWDDELAGESWSHGPIVLELADIDQDLQIRSRASTS
jgi:Mlc titration factor MtfA (ptsG expression regulator)